MIAPGLGARARSLVGRGLLCAAAGLAAAAAGGAAPEPLLTVEDAWVRGTVKGQTGSGAYMRLTSREDAQLVGAASPVAAKVEIHEMRTVNERMTMRRIDRLALPAHTPVALDHDYHVMFIGLTRQLQVGEQVRITLQLLDAHGRHHAVVVEAPVRPLNSAAPAHAPAQAHGEDKPHG